MAPRGRRGQPPDRLAGRGGSRVPPRARRLAGALSAQDAARLERARAYPFEITAGSFWVPGGAQRPAGEPGPRRLLAYGANRSLQGLARKLGGPSPSPSPPVAVLAARLHAFDVVYSAHVSPYGAVPATLQRRPGTTVAVHVLALDDAQVAAVDAFEPNYQRRRLEGISLELADGGVLEAVEAYVSLHGCLSIGGDARAVAAVPARGRELAELDEESVLALVRDRLAPGQDLDAFILAGIDDPGLQAERTATLRVDALGFGWI